MKAKVIIITCLYFFTIACEKAKKTCEVNDIITYITDRESYPMIPPPADDSTIIISKKTKDSLEGIKLKIAVFPFFQSLSIRDGKQNIESNCFMDAFEKGLDTIFTEKGHSVFLADTIKLKNDKEYQDFDLLFDFSQFYFSDNDNTVFFSLGISQSSLSGTRSEYTLNKKNGVWFISDVEGIEIW